MLEQGTSKWASSGSLCHVGHPECWGLKEPFWGPWLPAPLTEDQQPVGQDPVDTQGAKEWQSALSRSVVDLDAGPLL